ncbi:MAG TPA: DUF2231 domain-containing protein [Acidimicrobiales bacterium]|nr:DUF2231 domain-containing protein [Acidimicrobiales bacterium]
MATLAPAPAKQPVIKAAGPYGHPFHPILVTIPIGAWVSSLVFDIASRVNSAGSHSLVDAAYWLIGIGVVGALVSALFGLMDLLAIPRRTRALRIGLTHMGINLVIVALFVVDFFWRHSNDHYAMAKVPPGQLALSAVGIGLLLVSGWLGGMLAYRYGVRVVDEATQSEGFR